MPSPKDNHHSQPSRPKSLAKACLSCRTKKIRCDASQPRCSACLSQDRECVYRIEAPRKRPTFSQIHKLQRENAALQAFVRQLKSSSTPEERSSLLGAVVDEHGNVHVRSPPGPAESISSPVPSVAASVAISISDEHVKDKDKAAPGPSRYEDDLLGPSDDEELDIANFISVDEIGKARSFGPSSALHYRARSGAGAVNSPSCQPVADREGVRNALIAQAALQRQLEHRLAQLSSIDGTHISVALHLLNLHWTRQHHTFLLTYRPAIMRDLQSGGGPNVYGPHCSNFLLNAIFACSAKYSGLIYLRGNPDDPKTAGARFFRRCDELLAKESLLIRPTIPTIVGLLLLGSTYNSIGETSKGWLYTGYALRMVYDQGLHLDPEETTGDAEGVEIRRRVFWGAFICDKLQSLYLGRPVAINIRDSRVSTQLLDTYEENEIYCHPPDHPAHLAPPTPRPTTHMAAPTPVPISSVSTFQQLCQLSKIMTTIIDRFYVIGATLSNARRSLEAVNRALTQWKENLSPELDFRPWESLPRSAQPPPPPNLMVLHSIYHALVILLHRPFISDGHLRLANAPVHSSCWDRCSGAARCITSISTAYRATYGLAGAPYVLGYAAYVACTIHVRNAAAAAGQGQSGSYEHGTLLVSSLRLLDELCEANPGLAKPAGIIRRLIKVNGLDLRTDKTLQVSHSVASGDLSLDAIFNTFPASNVPEEPEGSNALNERGGLEFELPFDPLFGPMDSFELPFPVNLDTPTSTIDYI